MAFAHGDRNDRFGGKTCLSFQYVNQEGISNSHEHNIFYNQRWEEKRRENSIQW
jgi:hypothetical protein